MGRSIAIAVFAAVLAVATSLGAHAAGLGRLTVLSPLGQPLNAEIEIVSLQPGEEDGLTARLASAEAHRQAGIEFTPALLGATFTLERRNGRPLLRVRTAQPVNEPFVDLLVELQWNTGRLVREYTMLLDPPEYKQKADAAVAAATPAPAAPKPEAKPAPAAAAPKVEAKPLAPAPAAPTKPRATYEVKQGDTLAGIARQHTAPGVSLNQMLVAIYRANQDAFIRGNINLVRAGRILNIPAGEEAGGVAAEEANTLVRSQMAEFAEYRRRLAAAPAAADGAGGQREVTGRIEAKPGAEPPAAAQDQLRLSRADPAKPDAAGSRAARTDDRVAQSRAQKEAESRVAELEKNVADLQKLLALRNQQLAELEKKAGAKPAAEAPKPAAEAPKPAAEAPKPAAEAPKPAPDAPKPAAEAPKPAAEPAKPAAEAPTPAAVDAKKDAVKAAPAEAKKDAKAPPKKAAPPPPPEPSLIDEFLDNPLYLGLLGAVILLLIGYGAYAWKRKKTAQSRFQDGVLGASTGGAAALASAGALTPAAATAAPSSAQSQATVPAGMAATDEVDPIAEADVYMAYGRDAQAEEILKEALAKDPNRVPVLAKLCEIYANRRDAKAFEQPALKVKSQTNGAGPEWEKVAALGRGIDPQNSIYGSGEAAVAAPVAAAAAAAAPTLDFDIGGAPAQTTTPDITLDEPKDAAAPASIDFDLGAATTPSTAPAEGKKDEKSDFTPEGTLIMTGDQPSGSGGLDFDLGLGDNKEAAPAAPAPAPAPAAASEPSGLDFDLNLDLGALDKAAEPSASATSSSPTPGGAGSGALDMDLSSISLDLGSAGEPSAPAGGGDAKWQEVATKLDLAKAYEEMGDKDGARELLNEVMKDGDSAQQGQAQQLLAKLA